MQFLRRLTFPVFALLLITLPRVASSQTTAATISGQVTVLALALACIALLLAGLRPQALGLRQALGIRHEGSMLHSKTAPSALRPLTSLRPIASALSPLLVFLILAPALKAQTTAATISGQVVDSAGALVRGAQVELKSTLRGTSQTATTNDAGIYVFPTVDPGPYAITVRRTGFRQVDLVGLVANVQDHIEQNFKLSVGSVTESVTVEGSGVNINKSDGSVSTVVDSEMVKNMPLNGRSFQDLILLTPGVVTQTPQISSIASGAGLGQTGEFAVNGQRTESNYYTVDGVSANLGASAGQNMTSWAGASGSVAASTALGTTQALVSVDDLEEFRVQSSSYSAEYGRNPGGQFAFETKSGTNQLHGTGYDYLRNGVFDAQDWFNDYEEVKEPAIRQNDFGGTFGGALKIPAIYDGRGRTFFFASYEGLRLVAPQPVSPNVYVPDLCMRAASACPTTGPGAGRMPAAGPLLSVMNAFPVPSSGGIDDEANGLSQFLSSWSNPSSINAASVRLDETVGKSLRLFFRVSNSSSSADTRGTGGGYGSPASDAKTNYRLRTYTAGVNSGISNRFSNEFRANSSVNNTESISRINSFGGNTPVNLPQLVGLGADSSPLVLLIYEGYTVQLSQQKATGAQRQWNLVDTAYFTAGHHQLKFGADYRRLTPLGIPENPTASYFYTSESAVEANSALLLAFNIGAAFPLYENFSAFAQDEWKVARKLSLSIGLRWDLNPPPGVTRRLRPYTIQGASPSAWDLAPQGKALWQTTWHNFAPRLGVAYLVHDGVGRETALRGGFGVFFDTGQQMGSSGFAGPGFSSNSGFQVVSFPGNPADFVPPLVNPPVPPYFLVYGFNPHLQLPYTLQWNVSGEQGLGESQSLTLSYVGSHAARLLQSNFLQPAGNTNSAGFVYTQNGLTSDYHSLQVQFQRRLAKGLTGLTSYTWSHCLDYGSFNFAIGYQRGECDFDLRNNFAGAVSYDLPRPKGNPFVEAVLDRWGLDGRFTARSSFPVSLNGPAAIDPNTGNQISTGLDLVAGQPIYLFADNCNAVLTALGGLPLGKGCPGRRAINPCAFVPTTGQTSYPSCPAAGVVAGLVGRNVARGFNAAQMDLAARREFRLGEQFKLQFRAEAFNLFNHPDFGAIDTGFGDILFGQATGTLASSLGVVNPLYQQGGPRSMQFSLKLSF